jgi:hypothetical protein
MIENIFRLIPNTFLKKYQQARPNPDDSFPLSEIISLKMTTILSMDSHKNRIGITNEDIIHFFSQHPVEDISGMW